jgi:hypothetical protein
MSNEHAIVRVDYFRHLKISKNIMGNFRINNCAEDIFGPNTYEFYSNMSLVNFKKNQSKGY